MAGRRDSDDVGAGGDFRRKSGTNNSTNDKEETPAERRASEYVRTLLAEKIAIDQSKLPIAAKLLDQEVTKAQAEGKGPQRDQKFVDIYREKPVKVAVKVLVPVREHPKFNFVGKLLGPKGNSLKRLQEETMCRMAILGRGSMRDREKEEELRKSLESKYSHLTDDLHVEISALGPPAEAYARIAFALTEVRKYLTPDTTDDISQDQLREMETIEDRPPGPKGRGPPGGGPPFRHPGMRGGPPQRPPLRTATRMPVSGPRGMGGKPNALSILDRARAAMEDNYGGGYEEPYEPEPPFNNYQGSGPIRSGFGGGGSGGGNRFGGSDYDADYYGDDSDSYGGGENQRWKPYKAGGASARPEQSRYRPTPYSRAGK